MFQLTGTSYDFESTSTVVATDEFTDYQCLASETLTFHLRI